MQNDQINTICAKYQVDTMLSFSNPPGGMLSHVEDVTKERPVGSTGEAAVQAAIV